MAFRANWSEMGNKLIIIIPKNYHKDIRRLKLLSRLLHPRIDAMKLLLISDDWETIEQIKFICNSKGNIELRVRIHGNEGLEAIPRDKYDLVLLDLALSEFSGYDVLEALKERELLKTTNIVLFSTSSDRGLMLALKKKGAKEVIRKPRSLEDLSNIIEKYRSS